MTDAQFKVHFKRLETKYPKHFQGAEHRDREYADWYDNFHKLDYDVTKEAFDYYFRYLAQNWFPPIPDMLNCYGLMHKETSGGYKDEPVKRGSIKPLYEAIQEAKKGIAAGEVPLGFIDNKFKGGGSPAKYTTVKAMAECFVQMFDNHWAKPAFANYRKEKLEEKRVNKSKSEMLDGLFTTGSGKQIPQKLCYYCEKRLIKVEDVFKCNPCKVEYV